MAGRPTNPGISFYRMDSGHILNKKVRLLYNDHGSDGYYIWCCLLDYAYKTWGYYFDLRDEEEVELFASEFCKKPIALVQTVIGSCIKRNLFDKDIAAGERVLTSIMMQEVFLYATLDRRKKGSTLNMQEGWILIDLTGSIAVRIAILPLAAAITPGEIPIPPGRNAPDKDKTNTKTKTKIKPNGVAPAAPAPLSDNPAVKGKKKIAPGEGEPYWQQLVKVWFDFGKQYYGQEPSFKGQDPKFFLDIIKLLKVRAAKKQQVWNETTAPGRLLTFLEAAHGEDWLSKHFLLENLYKQFDIVIQGQKEKAAGGAVNGSHKNGTVILNPAEDLQYLQARFVDGQNINKLIKPGYFDYLMQTGAAEITEDLLTAARTQRVKNLQGSNQRHDILLMDAYETGNDQTMIEGDKPNLLNLAKRIGVYNWIKSNVD